MNLEESHVDKILSNVDEDEDGHLYGVHGSSGGYADTVFRYAAKLLYGNEIKGPLEYKTIRNTDFHEMTLEVSPIYPAYGHCFLRSVDLHNVSNLVEIADCNHHQKALIALLLSAQRPKKKSNDVLVPCQQKLAKREAGNIDRSQDIAHLQ